MLGFHKTIKMKSHLGIAWRNNVLKNQICQNCGNPYASSEIRFKCYFSNSSTDFIFAQCYLRVIFFKRTSLDIYKFWTFTKYSKHAQWYRFPNKHSNRHFSTSRSNDNQARQLKTKGVFNEESGIKDTTTCKESKVKKDGGYMFSDKARAGDVASAILSQRKFEDSVIIEINPGPGLLTKAILQSDNQIQKYIAVEANDTYKKSLEETLLKKYGPCLLVRKGTLLTKHFTSYTMKKYDKREEEILESDIGVKGKKHLTFVGPMLEPFEYTLNHLIHKLADKDGILNNFTPEYFYFVSPYLCRKLRNTELNNKRRMWYNASTVMIHQLFEYKFVAKVPLSSLRINPTSKRFIELKCPDDVITADQGYLLHLVPRCDVIQGIDSITCFYKFLQQNLSYSSRKADRFIPKMCELFPDSGIHLIRLGISMMDRVYDISPQQFFQIYQEMKTWPGYEDSALFSVISEEDMTRKISLETQSTFIEHSDKIRFLKTK